MKGKMTGIIAGTVGTMLVVTGFILPASAHNLPRFIDAQKPNHVLFPPIRPNPIIFAQADHRTDPLHYDANGRMTALSDTLNNDQRKEVRQAIDALDFHELQGGAGTAERVGRIRIDRQGQTGNNEQNIQIQLDGVRGRPSTVGTVLIPNQYINVPLNDHGRAQVINRTRTALRQSFFDYIRQDPTIYRLDGFLSN